MSRTWHAVNNMKMYPSSPNGDELSKKMNLVEMW